MYKGRVLVVDDLPDARATLMGLLKDAGYLVRSASNRVEALQLLETERFHVAVLDVRLDESDELNEEGLALMYQVKQRDPATAIIILTAFATVEMALEARQPRNDGPAPAFAFLEKKQTEKLCEFVTLAFAEELKLNFDLEILDPERILERLPRQIRFVHVLKPYRKHILDEAEEILRRLFFDCERIELHPMHRGFSGVAVIQVVPWYRNNARGETVVAKIGECSLVEREYASYHDLVQGRVGGHRLPKTLGIVRTRSLAGLVYTFAGLGSSVDFATFYEKSDSVAIARVIENLFVETCFPWRRDSAALQSRQDLRAVFLSLLRLTPEKLSLSMKNILGGRHPFRRDADGALWLGTLTRLIDPVAFALSADFHSEFYASTIHGDVQGYNVLVDHRDETWLIDFASASEGPLLHDYATFETFLRITMVKVTKWDLFYAWERCLFSDPDWRTPALPANLADNVEIAKAHHAVVCVRRFALVDATPETERAYLIALLFNVLKLVTVMDMAPERRDHVLISAAVIAERLREMG